MRDLADLWVDVRSASHDHLAVRLSSLAGALLFRRRFYFEFLFAINRFGHAVAADATHHDHLIDVETGRVIEFVDEELEALQRRIAEKLGFRLVDHRMELYGVALDRDR